LDISQILLISLIGFLLVIVVLAVIALVVMAISKLIQLFQKEEAKPIKPVDSQPVVDTGLSAGQLKLLDTDEKTAAIIMAIVSDQTGIPLSRLVFKSIKLLKD